MEFPQILAIDIGAGTQDILLYQCGREEENNPQLVLPSPSKVWAKRLEGLKADIFLHGDTIGGGSIGTVLGQHMKKGHNVYMTEMAARTIRDDLNEVREMGVEVVVEDRPTGFVGDEVELIEVDIPFVMRVLNFLGEGEQLSVVAIAVQDHGSSPYGESDRTFRFSCFRRALEEDKGFARLTYVPNEIPPYYHRMLSAVQRVMREGWTKIIVMDTAISAIIGAESESEEPQLVANIGNGHTIMALIIKGEIQGLLEHHTSLLTPDKLRDLIIRFPRGEVNNEEIYDGGGHGAFLLTKPEDPVTIAVTGPKRGIMKETGLTYHLPAPGGNMMMTGPWGLVRGARIKGLLPEDG